MKALKQTQDDLLKIELAGGEVLEISEDEEDGLTYIHIRTSDGLLVIYPLAGNVLKFKVRTEADDLEYLQKLHRRGER